MFILWIIFDYFAAGNNRSHLLYADATNDDLVNSMF